MLRQYQDDRFVRLMTRVKLGDEAAVAELVGVCERTVQHAVRRAGKSVVRNAFDTVDFAQDVWREFFSKSIRKYEFTTPDALLGFLANMAQKCVFAQLRRVGTKLPPVATASIAACETEHSGDGTPDNIVAATEIWENILKNATDGSREILVRFLAGETKPQIAEATGASIRTINRVLRNTRNALENESPTEDSLPW